MNYKILVFAAALVSVFTMGAFAQQVGTNGAVSTLQIIDTNAGANPNATVATQLVQTLLVDNFNEAGEWNAFIPRDYGIATAMRREGVPRDLASDNNKYSLGVKIEFMKRDWSWVSITPAKPIKIKGITKTVSVWVVGRNYKHTLILVLKDYLDREKYVTSEKMIWVGWKQVNINIPDTIEQENYKVTEERGITFEGFRIEFDPDDMLGRPFYTYFNYLTADTDLYSEENQNPDDMIDNW